MDKEHIIEVEGLAKRFQEVKALESVSFQVNRGEIFGFLGPNGAGKTTTINILTGLARPDAGTIRLNGLDCAGDPKRIQGLIGVVPDESNLYPELTGFENLCFCASLYGLNRRTREDRAGRLLEEFGLVEAKDRKFAGYSKGMKRKLTIAAGIVHQPELLFLDEPTTGIDTASARRIRELIRRLNRDGCTVFLTTHYLEEAERLCDRVAFIVKGRIVRIETVAALMSGFQDRKTILFAVSHTPPRLHERLEEKFPGVACERVSETSLRLRSGENIELIPFIQFFQDQQVEVLEARRVGPSFEDVFIEVTGLESEILKDDRAGQGKGK
ncbi:MAG: ABC transporter ATP-binding protein [Pseudomonadota bacterium]